MIKCTLGIFSLILIFCALASPALAQDWQATAQAAEQDAQYSQWRADAARKTATYAERQATAQAHAAATAQAIEATATAQAQAIEATRAALDTRATATAQAQAIEATRAAIQIERDRIKASKARAWGALATYTAYALLFGAALVCIVCANVVIRRALGEKQEKIIDAEYTVVSQGPYLLPFSENGKRYTPAYLRRKQC